MRSPTKKRRREQEKAMLLRNARLIDGTGQLLDRTDIRIEGYRIGAIGRGLPPQKEEWDLGGATVIPGLINAHVHLVLDAGPDPIGRAVQLPPAYLALEAGRRAEAMLRAGITTARDLGGIGHADLALRRAIAEGVVQGPRLLVSGRLICMTGGHGWQMGVEADGPDAVRKAARAEIKAGVDVVKIMATGGIMTAGVQPGAAQFTEEEIRAAVEEAHKASLRTATHAQGTTGIRNAVRAGIDSRARFFPHRAAVRGNGPATDVSGADVGSTFPDQRSG
jgi:imidazolonepropionase-like amidohydrolase